MEVTDFTIRIILLIIPGLISYLIINKFTETKDDNLILDFTKIVIYSFLNYSIYACLKLLLSIKIASLDSNILFLKCLTDSTISISWSEIIITAFISIISSCFIAKLINISWFHKTAQSLNITNKFSDIDVWSYLFNSKNKFYIIIRDIEHNLTYQGYPQVFSKDHKQGEILLVNVNIYRYDDSKFLYHCDSIYYKFNSEIINFEIQLLEEDINE